MVIFNIIFNCKLLAVERRIFQTTYFLFIHSPLSLPVIFNVNLNAFSPWSMGPRKMKGKFVKG